MHWLITHTQVLCQGCELITANYMFCTFACLAAAPEDRANEIKATAKAAKEEKVVEA